MWDYVSSSLFWVFFHEKKLRILQNFFELIFNSIFEERIRTKNV